MNLANGLLGMGGINALGGNSQPISGLLGQYYDPAELKKQKTKAGLLQAGIALLTQQPQLGQGIGTSLGTALRGGVEGAQQAQQDYMQNARMAYDMNRQAKDDAWQSKTRERQQHSWDSEDQAKEARKAFYAALPEDQRQLAEAYPEQFGKLYAKAKLEQAFPDPDAAGVYGNPLPVMNEDNSFGYAAMGKKGGSVPIPPPNGSKWLNPLETSQMKSEGTQTGKNTADVKFEIPKAEMVVQSDLQKIDEVLKHPGLDAAVGTVQGGPLGNSIMGTINSDASDFLRRVEQLRGGSFLQAYQILKGGGQIANAEGAKAEMAIARLNTAVSEKDFKQALEDYKTAIQRGLASMKAQVGQSGSPLSGGNSGGWSIQEVPE